MFHLTIVYEFFDCAGVFRIGRRPYAEDPEYQRQKAVSEFLQEIRHTIPQLAPLNAQNTILLDAAIEGALRIIQPALEDIYNWGYLTWHDYPPHANPRKAERIRRAILASWTWKLSEELLVQPAHVKALVLAVRPYDRPILADPGSRILLPLRAAIFAAAAPYLAKAWEQGNTDARDDVEWSRMWPDMMKERSYA